VFETEKNLIFFRDDPVVLAYKRPVFALLIDVGDPKAALFRLFFVVNFLSYKSLNVVLELITPFIVL
jgi:hypothetical protein